MELTDEKLDNVIGFQVHTINGTEIHPKMESIHSVYSLPQCMAILLETDKTERPKYEVVHIFYNTFDQPLLHFKGNPFTSTVKDYRQRIN